MRKIVVNGKEYLWQYSFDDYDYQMDSYLTIKTADRKGKLMISFRGEKNDFGYCPFNKGLEAICRGEKVIINLNQPRFVAELIAAALAHLVAAHLEGTTMLKNGVELLRGLGYEFEYGKRWD